MAQKCHVRKERKLKRLFNHVSVTITTMSRCCGHIDNDFKGTPQKIAVDIRLLICGVDTTLTGLSSLCCVFYQW